MPNTGMRALVWLAIHGLPMFPCFVQRGRLLPRGFVSRPDEMRMMWPLWRPFLDDREIGTLIGQTTTAERREKDAMLGRDVLRVYSSKRAKLTKYMVSLMSPRRIV